MSVVTVHMLEVKEFCQNLGHTFRRWISNDLMWKFWG